MAGTSQRIMDNNGDGDDGDDTRSGRTYVLKSKKKLINVSWTGNAVSDGNRKCADQILLHLRISVIYPWCDNFVSTCDRTEVEFYRGRHCVSFQEPDCWRSAW
jgi:hypothetical protein